ncbi:hypothetical protein J1N35_040561 [Gossypium stocksii]|uniref:Uncharacterized protein n=1 Tax=Gossypium stocksii TaxID=47602 RepID=A0A9D3ZIM2_9ROSI|nr:hypothetical protein J1N35_040561 [Gossypium stocksii]
MGKVCHQCMRRGIPANTESLFDLEIDKTLRRKRKELRKMVGNRNDLIGDEEEANPLVAPPMDSTATIPPHSTKPMTEQDHEIDCIIDELTRSDNEEEDVPLNLLKRLMRYKMSARRTTRHN